MTLEPSILQRLKSPSLLVLGDLMLDRYTWADAEAHVLVVGVNSDASVRRLKGVHRPIIPQDHRAAMLAALDCVAHVLIFDEDTPHALLHRIRPEVLVKGGKLLSQRRGRQGSGRAIRRHGPPDRNAPASFHDRDRRGGARRQRPSRSVVTVREPCNRRKNPCLSNPCRYFRTFPPASGPPRRSVRESAFLQTTLPAISFPAPPIRKEIPSPCNWHR